MAKMTGYMAVVEETESLGVSRNPLRQWNRIDKLRARRHPITGHRRYRKTELEAFIRQIQSGTGRLKRTSRGVREAAKRKDRR